MLHMLQIRSAHGHDQVLHVLQNLNVCTTGFIFVFILNVGSEKKLLIHVEKTNKIGTTNIVNHHHVWYDL